MSNVIQIKRRSSLPEPTPWSFYEAGNGEWVVCRETYQEGEPEPGSFSDAPIMVNREIAGRYPIAYDAIAKCYELNGYKINPHPLDALAHLFHMATHHHTGGSRVIAMFLLGLYNGERFKFDLTDLRRLDERNQECVLSVLRLDIRPQREVHDWLNLITNRTDFGRRFEELACSYNVENSVPAQDDDPVLEPFRLPSPLN